MCTGIKFCEKQAKNAIINNKTFFLPLTTDAIFLETIAATPVLLIATANAPSRI